MQISKDRIVTVEYTLRSDGGEVIDSSDHSEPLSFIQGRGSVFPALELQLEGHGSGERLKVDLSAAQAYGERDERLIKVVPRKQFKFSEELSPGMHYKTSRNGEEIDVTITEVGEETVTIDANPPLAGMPVSIDLVVTEVREASPEELESGVVQTTDDIYSQAAHK